jgi:hypothetical protein
MGMTSRLEARVIAKRVVLKRRELNGGLAAPPEASDASSAARFATAERRAVLRRLDFVASSVAMSSHRARPSFLPDSGFQLVTHVSRREVMP